MNTKILVGKHEEKRRRDNIRMDVMEMGWEGVDWMHLVQDKDRGNEPSDSIRVKEFID
jgi:hypothetical protein